MLDIFPGIRTFVNQTVPSSASGLSASAVSISRRRPCRSSRLSNDPDLQHSPSTTSSLNILALIDSTAVMESSSSPDSVVTA